MPLADIPGLDLGEALYVLFPSTSSTIANAPRCPKADLQTHHTVQGPRGFINYVPMRQEARGAEARGGAEERRKRKAIAGGCCGVKRRRKCKKEGRERGLVGGLSRGRRGMGGRW